MIQPGEQAPDFTLPDQDGNPVSLSDLRGKRVVYFYPKADTPGCTTQACGVRDHLAEYQAVGAVVLGISPDPVDRVNPALGAHLIPPVVARVSAATLAFAHSSIVKPS